MNKIGLVISNMEKMKKKGNLRRFWPYYKKYRGWIALDLFCAAVTSVCEIVLPLIVRYLTELGFNETERLSVGLILGVAAAYLAMRAIDSAAYYFMSYRGHVTGTEIERDMRSEMFKHLEKLSLGYYSQTKIGQIVSRMTSDLFDVAEFAHHCPEEFFIAFLKIVSSFIILCTINVPLTVIMFVVIPVMVFVSAKFNRKLREMFRAQRVQLGEINAQMEDSLSGIRVVKSFARENEEIEKFERGNREFYNIKSKSYRYFGLFNTVTRAFDGVMYIVVVAFGSFFMMKKAITPADLTAYLLYTSTLIAAIRRVVEFTEQFQRGMTGVDRFFEIMDVEPEIIDSPDAVALENVRGDVTFENVTFHYTDDKTEVLENVNLDVKAGSHVALVGPSGSGKTTLCNLIPRFYEISGGSIKIDGKDIRSLTIKSLRESVGTVQQDVYLFSGTVYENISFGAPGATLERVKEAARLAGADAFIEALPDGYDTYVGERGVRLSGGQKQRISIARVFLKNPPILILDEATSALDNESEFIVQKSLERLAEGRTTFTVAHRLTTIMNADEILVLTENGIEERGTHLELIKKGGIYSRLYSRYQAG